MEPEVAAHLMRLDDDNLLDVSRLSHGKINLQTGRTALSDIVESGVVLTQHLITDAGHALPVSLSREPLVLDATLFGSRRRLPMFSTTRLNSLPNPVGFGWRRNVQQPVVVTVSDNGRGISIEKPPTIFEPVNQLGSQTAVLASA